MDIKISQIEKFLAHKKQSFGHMSITVVDGNGNTLLNTSKYGKEVVTEECKVIKEINITEKKKQEENTFGKEKSGVAEENLVISKELTTDNDTSNEIDHVSKEDSVIISALLDGKRGQIFTATLNKSNYICFTDGKGTLIGRKNFNVSKETGEMHHINGKKAKAVHDNKFDGRFNQPVSLLVANKVTGILTVVTGDINFKCSMVDVVKEISQLLKD